MSKLGIIEQEPDGRCDLCGKTAETRPYGPKGESVCFECGMKDKQAASRRFEQHVLGRAATMPESPRSSAIGPIPPRLLNEYNAWRVSNGLGTDSADATGFLSRWLAHELQSARDEARMAAT